MMYLIMFVLATAICGRVSSFGFRAWGFGFRA